MFLYPIAGCHEMLDIYKWKVIDSCVSGEKKKFFIG